MSKQREKYEVTVITRGRNYKTEVMNLSNTERYQLMRHLLELNTSSAGICASGDFERRTPHE